jgi:hypothetical protein
MTVLGMVQIPLGSKVYRSKELSVHTTMGLSRQAEPLRGPSEIKSSRLPLTVQYRL